MEAWTREASTKRWEENEARLSAMSLDNLKVELATIEDKEDTITEGIMEDMNYDTMADKERIEQATLVMEKIILMMQRMDLNRHISHKQEAICS